VKRKRLFIIIAVSIAAAAVLALAVFTAWRAGAFLPGWIRWQNGQASGNEPLICLENKKVTVFSDEDQVAWESPEGVLVQDALFEDIDSDGERELMLLCWKIGRYGKVKPKFGAPEVNRWVQHIYIYDWRERSIHAIWMASDIGLDVESWSFDEGKLALKEPSGKESKWAWYDWGLELSEEVKK